MGSVYLSQQNLTNLLILESYLFPVPAFHEAERISGESLDNDLLSAKSLRNGPPVCSSFFTLDVLGWVFVVVQADVS